MNKYTLYRFLSPFRSRHQKRLREERLDVDIDTFAQGFEEGLHPDVPRLLWELLRDVAFVPDFRPDPDDNLVRIYAMGPEEALDDLIEPLLDKLELSKSKIDFNGLDLSSLNTPRDVASLIAKVANARHGQG